MIRLPMSPFCLKQEIHRDHPWQMLITCMMLNQTSYRQVDQIRDRFFQNWPDAQSFLNSSTEEVIDVIRILGFYNRRDRLWRKFSQAWLEAVDIYQNNIPIEHIERLPGVGKYTSDSWRVFQLYQYDIEVQDHALVWYVEWARKQVLETFVN